MLKNSKLSHKSKSSKDSPLRKNHLSKKNMRSRSPVRLPGSSRPPPMKHISPGMKRGHPIPKRKTSHSPRLRPISSSPHRSLPHRSKPESPVSMDRARAMKSLKYEKRKPVANSPMRHLGPSGPHRPISPHRVRDISPYLADQYQGSTIPHSQQYSPPMRKKVRRSMSASPPRRHASGPIHSDGHIPRRSGNMSPVMHQKHPRNIPLNPGERPKQYDMRSKLESPPIMSRSHSKDLSLKVPYQNEGRRYRSPSPPSNRYPASGSKSYGPTLHERFSSVIESSRTEPRIRYSREDLEKITIDIRRPVRDSSPPPPPSHHMINPPNVKLIHRTSEVHRPIFDREEIKQQSRYLREEPYIERKTNAYASHPIDLRNVENYQITRHRYDTHHDVYPSTSGRSLSDRWQNIEGRKDAVSLDRDEREKDYVRAPVSRSRVDVRSRSRSGDRDFRSERYIDPKPSSIRAEYQSRPLPPPPDSRNSPPYSHRKSSLPLDARHKLNFRKSDRESHPSSVRSDAKSHYLPSDHRYPEDLPPPRVERRDHHSPVPEPHKWSYKSRSPSREKLPDFPRRLEKYDYKPWIDKPDISTRGPTSYEQESREGPSSFRGNNRPFRNSRGFRSRGFRGPMRGSTYRGSLRGNYRNSLSPRGRGIPRR